MSFTGKSLKDHIGILLYTNTMCYCVFKNITLEELENYMMKGIHEIPAVKSGMDLVKKSFSKRMIEAATSHKSLTSTPSKFFCLNSISSPFHKKGWLYQRDQHFALRINKNPSYSNYS